MGLRGITEREGEKGPFFLLIRRGEGALQRYAATCKSGIITERKERKGTVINHSVTGLLRHLPTFPYSLTLSLLSILLSPPSSSPSDSSSSILPTFHVFSFLLLLLPISDLLVRWLLLLPSRRTTAPTYCTGVVISFLPDYGPTFYTRLT